MKILVTLAACVVLSQAPSKPGILLLAHGGSAAWNEQVAVLASQVNASVPTEVALGMASRSSIQDAVDRLKARGATEIRAVPLFVSSHSSVITSTQYLLGLRAEAPKDLAAFARMRHGAGGGHGDHASHAAPVDPMARVDAGVPIRMSSALDSHAVVSDIVVTRAREVSVDPAAESVILVAHGPVPDDDNRLWLRDLDVHAGRLRQAMPLASVDALTVRDDAPAPIRDAATAELRALVSRRVSEGRRVLIVPVLLSFGGIEAGIRKRLDGLPYTMATRGLIPDDRLVDWVLASANAGR